METMSSTVQGPLVALLMALPALAGALGVSVMEGGKLAAGRPAGIVSGALPSFAEAVESGYVERVHAIIRAGHDPRDLVWYRHPDLTGGVTIRTAPLLIAVARRDENMVMTLLSAGAGSDLTADQIAACLAEGLGEFGVARAIRATAGRPLRECPPYETVTSPLISYWGPEEGSN